MKCIEHHIDMWMYTSQTPRPSPPSNYTLECVHVCEAERTGTHQRDTVRGKRNALEVVGKRACSPQIRHCSGVRLLHVMRERVCTCVIASAHACMHGHTSAIKSHKADHIHARRDMSVGVCSMSARDLAEGDHIVDKKGPLRLAHQRAS